MTDAEFDTEVAAERAFTMIAVELLQPGLFARVCRGTIAGTLTLT